MRFVRRHMSYANVAATLALLLAMGGGALAATHYLITSTAQISPRVLSQLRGHQGAPGKPGKTGRTGRTGKPGKTGRTGRQGAPGPAGGPRGRTGPEGPAGAQGLPGTEGREGKEGKKGPRGEEGPRGLSALEPLHAKEAESGLYGISVGASPGKVEYEAVSLPVLLGAAIPVTNVEYVPAGTKTKNCEKPGTAAGGFLCIYSNFPQEKGVLAPPKVLNIEAAKPGEEGSGPHGFVLEWVSPEAEAHDVGTYTITEK
jgi:hypothetical protein